MAIGLGLGPGLSRGGLGFDFAQAGIIQPSAGYTGTAGSGFGGAYGAVPTDPTRTTAKPACRLITVPHQYFTDQLLVGVAAAANNNGSLANLGLTKVRFHYEGSVYDVTRPTWQTLTDVNGVKRRYMGWWIWLKKTGTGAANLYAEAVPADGTMQHRVMGPYPFYPTAALHDYDLTVAPSLSEVAGSRYQTVGAALDYLRTQSAQNPRITITEAGNYEISTFTQATTYRAQKGWCTIRATATVVIRKASFDWANSALVTNYGGIKFTGSNITFDIANVASISLVSTPAHDHWADGVTFTNSAGRNSFWAKGIRPISGIFNSNPYITECVFTHVSNPAKGAEIVRGCSFTDGYDDILTSSKCAIGTTVQGWDASFFNGEVPAFTVQYGGAGAAATLSLTGTNDAASRTFTAKVDGASVGTFAVVNSSAGFAAGTNYDVADVVTWLNTLSGWTATLLDDTRRATACTLAGSKGSFSNVNCKSTPLTVITRFDLHADWYQQLTSNTDNIILTDNTVAGVSGGQLVFLTGAAGLRDFIFINCAVSCAAGFAARSQIEGATSHLVIAHCVISNQSLQLSYGSAYSADSYCLIANTVLLSMATTGTVSANVPAARDNHLFAAYSAIWPFATGTTTGGDSTTLFVDEANGDFTPAGALLTNLKVPIVSRDVGAVLRGATAAAGAVA